MVPLGAIRYFRYVVADSHVQLGFARPILQAKRVCTVLMQLNSTYSVSWINEVGKLNQKCMYCRFWLQSCLMCSFMLSPLSILVGLHDLRLLRIVSWDVSRKYCGTGMAGQT